MTPAGKRLLSLYRHALRLYPRSFREAYGEEMTAVFALRLQGGRADAKTALRELRDLPLAVLAAYLRERRRQKMKHSINNWFSNSSGSWRELLLALLPFLLMGFVPGLLSKIPPVQQLPQVAGFLILGSLFLILAALGIIGLLVSLPRWSLTYAGVSLTVFALSMVASPLLFGNISLLKGWSPLQRNAVLMGIFLLLLALSTGILLWAAARIRLMRSFADQLKRDHSLVSFMLYGGALVLTLSHYEDIDNGGGYLMLTALAMAAGVWGYLRFSKPTARIGALVGGATFGSAITLTAALLLTGVPHLAPISFGGLQIDASVGFVGLTWLTSLLMILVPVVFTWRAAAPSQIAA